MSVASHSIRKDGVARRWFGATIEGDLQIACCRAAGLSNVDSESFSLVHGKKILEEQKFP